MGYFKVTVAPLLLPFRRLPVEDNNSYSTINMTLFGGFFG
jgi:hypothetical protein